MDRRDFFKRTGLGIGGIFLAKNLIAQHLDSELPAEDTLRYAIDYLLEGGAEYVDARIGECELMGRDKGFLPNSLFRAELLGIRVVKDDVWYHAVISDLGQPSLTQSLDRILQSEQPEEDPNRDWIAAVFHTDKVMADHSSDPEITSELDRMHLRFARRTGIPKGTSDLLFCDLLIVE